MILLKTFAFIDEYDLAACRSFAAVLQKAVFRIPKDRQLHAKRPPFTV